MRDVEKRRLNAFELLLKSIWQTMPEQWPMRFREVEDSLVAEDRQRAYLQRLTEQLQAVRLDAKKLPGCSTKTVKAIICRI